MNYTTLAPKQSLEKTVHALTQKTYNVSIVTNKTEALEKIKTLIPSGASVMNGSSTTLQQIGYEDYLKENTHTWVNLHEKVTAENDPKKRAELRKQSAFSDYYLGSVQAVTEDGDLLIASNTGSQLPQIVFTSPNLLFIISTKKIVPNLDEAMKRLNDYVLPLEDERAQQAYGAHTALNKIVIFKGESPMIGRKIHIIFIEEDLGF